MLAAQNDLEMNNKFNRKWVLFELKQSLRALAAPGPIALAMQSEGTVNADELALDYDNFVTAALGGELEVPTLDGRVVLKIPAETQTGKMFRMRGKGVKSVRGGAVGYLLCRVLVETPVNLNKSQKDK